MELVVIREIHLERCQVDVARGTSARQSHSCLHRLNGGACEEEDNVCPSSGTKCMRSMSKIPSIPVNGVVLRLTKLTTVDFGRKAASFAVQRCQKRPSKLLSAFSVASAQRAPAASFATSSSRSSSRTSAGIPPTLAISACRRDAAVIVIVILLVISHSHSNSNSNSNGYSTACSRGATPAAGKHRRGWWHGARRCRWAASGGAEIQVILRQNGARPERTLLSVWPAK